jgi:hypothetical protein
MYIFPSNSIIEPQGRMVLLATTNIAVETFRTDHQIPPEVPILQHDYDLQNSGERFVLSKPNDPLIDPPIPVDQVRYNDRSPWPPEADGEGPSLERVNETAYSNDPLSWRSSAYGGTPGRPGDFGSVIAIATNSTWKYFAKGFNLGSAWSSTSYPDSSWAATDGILGIGQPFVDSILDFGPVGHPPVTTYFRKEFVISDPPGMLNQLDLKVNYDDGFVAYINGQEVARRSLPGGVIEFDTLAAAHEGGNYEVIDLLAHANLLQQGGNVLAIEVHQASVADPDLVWDASLVYGINPALFPYSITDFGFDLGGNVILEWESISGQTYHVEQSDDLQLWSDISGPLPATEPLRQYIHSITPDESTGFFRIRISE